MLVNARIEVEHFEDLVSRHGEFQGDAYPMVAIVRCNGNVIGFILQKFNGAYVATFPEDSLFSPMETSYAQAAYDHLYIAAMRFAHYFRGNQNA